MTTFDTGNPLGSPDPRDLFDNAQNLDSAANDPDSLEWVDRLGNVRKTWRGVELSAPIAVAASEAAAASAEESREFSIDAERARDGALVGAEFYATETAGRTAVGDGETFKVIGSGDASAFLYRRVSASVSTLLAIFPSAAAVSQKAIGFVDAMKRREMVNQTLNGAVVIPAFGDKFGLLIPAGQSGAGAYSTAFINLSPSDVARLSGCTVEIRAIYDATTSFLENKGLGGVFIQVRRGSVVNNVGTLVSSVQVGGKIARTIRYVVTAADTAIGATVQIPSTANALPADYEIKISELNLRIYEDVNFASSIDTQTASEYMLEAYAAQFSDSVLDATSSNIVDIRNEGSDLSAANSKSYGRPSGRHVIKLPSGAVPASNVDLKAYTDIRGAGKSLTSVSLDNPDNIDPAQIKNYQPLWVNRDSRLEGVSVYGRNVRYALHSDSGGSEKNKTQIYRGVRLEHGGNQGARDYQTSIGGDPNAVWTSEYAFGCGVGSGQKIVFDCSDLIAPRAALHFHNSLSHETPAQVISMNGRLLATQTPQARYSVLVQPIGSGVNDSLVLLGNLLGGTVQVTPDPWLPTSLDRQPADHMEISISGHGNSPAPCFVDDFGRALRITSNSTSGVSSVAVTGNAVPVIFGGVDSQSGGGNVDGFLQGYAQGKADISGVGVGPMRDVFITSLASRLGNRTGSPLTLSVTVDGGSPINIALNQNFTGMTNAAIIAVINGALGSAAVASEFAPGNLFRPQFADQELLMVSESQGIARGMALAFDGHWRKARKMTQSDPASVFAGFAMFDMYPGQWTRVKRSGFVQIGDINRSDLSAQPVGTQYSIGAIAGRLVPGGSQKIVTLIGLAPSVVRIGTV